MPRGASPPNVEEDTIEGSCSGGRLDRLNGFATCGLVFRAQQRRPGACDRGLRSLACDPGPATRGLRSRACDAGLLNVACSTRSGYSPMTDQRKPIMMKKPTNNEMSAKPPYGESAPSCGTTRPRTIPDTAAQATNRRAKRIFELGLVMARTQTLCRPLSYIAARQATKRINPATAADTQNGTR